MSIWIRIFGRAPSTPRPAEMTQEMAVKIVQDYGAILESSSPGPGRLADASLLPYPKEQIKAALLFAIRLTPDPHMKQHLRIAVVSLAEWQPGVGPRVLGLDMTKIKAITDPREQVHEALSQDKEMEKWLALVRAEEIALNDELQRLGL